MTREKHTPGEWRYDRGEGCVYTRFDPLTKFVVAMMESGTQDEQEANARLIAAAPELLIAVQRCLNFIEGAEAESGEKFECGNIARAAVAKAEGRS